MSKNTEKAKTERAKKETAKDDKLIGKKKRYTSEAFEDVHAMEMNDIAERCNQKNAIRLKELELERQKQDFEREKHQAKVRKMELEEKKMEFEAKRMEMEAKKSEQTFSMMMRMMQSHADESISR